MRTQTIKVSIFVIVSVIFISMALPAGAGMGGGYGKSSMMFPGFDKLQGSMDSSYHPILTVEEPKMFFMVKDEEGNEIIVDMPKDIDEKEIEKQIIQKIEGVTIPDISPAKKKNANISEKDLEESPPNEPLEDPKQEESTKVILHLSYPYLIYPYEECFDGYLFCLENEMLHFDASLLFSTYNVIEYEWDFDGDTNYEAYSSSPIISYKYTTIGIYDFHIKITYNYSYSYYPINFNDYDYVNYPIQIGYSGITVDPPDPVSINTSFNKEISVSTQDKDNGVSYYSLDYLEPDYITPSIVEYQKSEEYEIKVSVGSEEKGYPPILDFELIYEAEEENLDNEEDYQIGIPSFGYKAPSLPYYTQPVYFPVNIRATNKSEATESKITPTIHVNVKDIEKDEVPHIDNYKVEFDASNTLDINEGTIYYWDFGDCEFGEGISISHTYVHRGTYTATLCVEGWDHSISKTFVVRRGFEDPKQVVVTYSYTEPIENYLICNMNEPMIFDIFDVIGTINLYYVEWDFNADGIYEENVTSPWIIKKFFEPGYFQVSFRYTYSYKNSPYIWWNQKLLLGDVQSFVQSPISYTSDIYWFKVFVKGEEDIPILIPDFTTEAPRSYSWWNQQEIYDDYHNTTEQKNVTYLQYYSIWNNRLNSWANPVEFNANSTLIPKGTTHDDFFYLWDFGDGRTATGIKVSHEFEHSNNNYQVKLTVWNDKYNVSVIKTVAPRPYSPNIYLYREKPTYDTIRVIVDGRVTKAVPSVELGTEIVWKDVFIENGKLLYNGEYYDFLYYEELLNEPRTSQYGWILERDEKGDLFLDGKLLSLEELKDFFRAELEKAGLFENEIEDFIDEWIGKGARLFPAKQPFRYAIMYVPENIMEEIIRLETDKTYDEIIRIHFQIQPVDGDISLVPPQYPNHEKGKNILHEWGVYFGNSISEDEKDDCQDSGLDNNIQGDDKSQMYIANENRTERYVMKPV